MGAAMDILVVGGGGREHALAWKLARSPRAGRVFVAPGNAGTARERGVHNVEIEAEDLDGLVAFARSTGVALTVVGPEAPLTLGISDRFRAAGLRCFGPDRQAARLEGSKIFAKEFLVRHGVPTARYGRFEDLDEALAHVREHGAPLVVKADGLAAGKGVVLAQSIAEAERAVRGMLREGAFGEAGRRIVIEEFLEGEEASFICLVGGGEALPMASSQDHKARDDGDAGPNTGGMGAYSPAPVVDGVVYERIMERVIRPTLDGLAADRVDYCGFLYAGLMIDLDGNPSVLEFNCRCGDPETQPIMMRLESDLVELCNAALDGELAGRRARWNPMPGVGVVMAAGGYPFDYARGDVVSGLDAVPDAVKVFHAGTAARDGRVVTSGGRVLCATALGDTVTEARRRAYAACERIHWPNAYFRRDIAHRALAREALGA